MTDTLDRRRAEVAAGTAEDPAKRRQILEGAKRVFMRAGYEGASMSLIAREADVSKGTLYVYFENKEALFAAFIQSECDLRGADLFNALDGDVPARDMLPMLGRRFLAFKLSPEPHAIERLVIGESAKFPELGRAFYDAGPKRGSERLADYLRARVGAGELDIDDPSLAAHQFLGLCQAELVLKRRMSFIETVTPQRIARVVDSAVALFLKGYAVRS